MEDDGTYDFTIKTNVEYRALEYCKNGDLIVHFNEDNIRDIDSKLLKLRKDLRMKLCNLTTSNGKNSFSTT